MTDFQSPKQQVELKRDPISPREIDPQFLAKLTIQFNLLLSRFKELSPYADFTNKEDVQFAFREKAEGEQHSFEWNREQKLIVITLDAVRAALEEREQLDQASATEAAAITLLPKIIHEIHHGITEQELERDLGQKFELPSQESESLSLFSEFQTTILMKEHFQDYCFRGKDTELAETIEKRLKEGGLRFIQTASSKLYSHLNAISNTSDVELATTVQEQIEEDEHYLAGLEEYTAKKHACGEISDIDRDYLESIAQEKRTLLERARALHKVTQDPQRMTLVRRYYSQKFKDIAIRYPGTLR